MHSNLRRLAALAAVGAVGILAPVASASASTPIGLARYTVPTYQLPRLPQYPTPTLSGFTPGALSFVGPSVGGISAVIGPTVITVGAGNIFTGTTITTTGGGAVVATGPNG
jgi:hypothetical protein